MSSSGFWFFRPLESALSRKKIFFAQGPKTCSDSLSRCFCTSLDRVHQMCPCFLFLWVIFSAFCFLCHLYKRSDIFFFYLLLETCEGSKLSQPWEIRHNCFSLTLISKKDDVPSSLAAAHPYGSASAASSNTASLRRPVSRLWHWWELITYYDIFKA